MNAALCGILIIFAVKFTHQMIQLAKRFRIKSIPEVEALCRISKDLYNQSLYELRKKGEEEGVWMGHYNLREHMKTVTNLEGNINYRLLRDAIADCVIKQVDKDKKSFFCSYQKVEDAS